MKLKYKYLLLIFLPSLFYSCNQLSHEEQYSELLAKYKIYWNTGQFDGIDMVLHEDFELRMTPKYESEKGVDLFRENVTKWRTAYPDFHIEEKEIFYTDKQAGLIWEITATNTGEGLHPPTHKSIKITGISIFHFLDGKIKDEWIASNNGYWLNQLGFKLVSPFEELKSVK